MHGLMLSTNHVNAVRMDAETKPKHLSRPWRHLGLTVSSLKLLRKKMRTELINDMAIQETINRFNE